MRRTLLTLVLLGSSLAVISCSSPPAVQGGHGGGGGTGGLDLSSCSNSVKDGQETDVDCGGPLCTAKCQDGMTCQFDLDCESAACSAGHCGKPTCIDGYKDGDESGVDCGGSDTKCPRCEDQGGCLSGSDCKSAVCTEGVCRAATCSDGKLSPGEVDVDCGGPCPRCGHGASCNGNGDCQDDVCSGGVCVGGSCLDGVKNQNESAIDCGGTCTPCADGIACNADPDCQSKSCAGGLCVAPTCADGRTNGTESDRDCGGDCGPCANGQTCNWNSDCASFVCAAGADPSKGSSCQVPSCSDLTANGDETGIDCGGPTCGACPPGQPCQAEKDCQSSVCTNGFCAAPTCTDAHKNADESDVDCGGMTCPGCAGGLFCNTGKDCYSTVCLADGTCTTPTCSDRIRNQDESDVDCGGSTCNGCNFNERCQVNGDCKTGWCNPATNRCGNIVCGDGIVQPGEQCDDKNLVNDDGCSNNCQLARCGDGIVQPFINIHTYTSPEVTSPYGVKAHVSWYQSNTACQIFNGAGTTCPNLDKNGGFREHGICQALGYGRANSVTWAGGSGAADSPVVHLNNWSCSNFRCGPSGDRKTTTLNNQVYMLKSIDCEGEACDDGVNNAKLPDHCRPDCTFPRCGDNVVDAGEDCDDGNFVNGDGCDDTCHFEN